MKKTIATLILSIAVLAPGMARADYEGVYVTTEKGEPVPLEAFGETPEDDGGNPIKAILELKKKYARQISATKIRNLEALREVLNEPLLFDPDKVPASKVGQQNYFPFKSVTVKDKNGKDVVKNIIDTSAGPSYAGTVCGNYGDSGTAMFMCLEDRKIKAENKAAFSTTELNNAVAAFNAKVGEINRTVKGNQKFTQMNPRTILKYFTNSAGWEKRGKEWHDKNKAACGTKECQDAIDKVFTMAMQSISAANEISFINGYKSQLADYIKDTKNVDVSKLVFDPDDYKKSGGTTLDTRKREESRIFAACAAGLDKMQHSKQDATAMGPTDFCFEKGDPVGVFSKNFAKFGRQLTTANFQEMIREVAVARAMKFYADNTGVPVQGVPKGCEPFRAQFDEYKRGFKIDPKSEAAKLNTPEGRKELQEAAKKAIPIIEEVQKFMRGELIDIYAPQMVAIEGAWEKNPAYTAYEAKLPALSDSILEIVREHPILLLNHGVGKPFYEDVKAIFDVANANEQQLTAIIQNGKTQLQKDLSPVVGVTCNESSDEKKTARLLAFFDGFTTGDLILNGNAGDVVVNAAQGRVKEQLQFLNECVKNEYDKHASTRSAALNLAGLFGAEAAPFILFGEAAYDRRKASVNAIKARCYLYKGTACDNKQYGEKISEFNNVATNFWMNAPFAALGTIGGVAKVGFGIKAAAAAKAAGTAGTTGVALVAAGDLGDIVRAGARLKLGDIEKVTKDLKLAGDATQKAENRDAALAEAFTILQNGENDAANRAKLQNTWEKLARERKVNNFAKEGGSAADLLKMEELSKERILELRKNYGKSLGHFHDPQNEDLALQIAHLKDESLAKAGMSLEKRQAEVDRTFEEIIAKIKKDPRCDLSRI
jgi:hypothetical protein